MADVILVVDDEPAIQQSLAMLLGDEGFTVRCAQDGIEALAHHERDPADLILPDIMMPKVDGITLVDEPRKRGDGTPVVLMSAVPPPHVTFEVVRFIAKPFDVSKLLDMVHQSLGEARDSSL